MAAVDITLKFQAVALVAATAKTVGMLTAPTNQALRVKEIAVSFDGAVSTNTPVLVEYGRPSTAGTFTSQTPSKDDDARTETVQATGGVNASAEPTMTSENAKYVGQFNGLYHYMVSFNKPLLVKGGARFAIRCTSPNNVNCSGHISVEE